jgi:cytochrome c553
MKNIIFTRFFVRTRKMAQAKLCLLLMLGLTSATATANEVDNRQVLNLTEPQRHQLLTEMRELLAGTQGILEALAKDDMAAVAEHSRALGFEMKHKAENPLHDVLPKEFMQIGMPMHKEFDLIAADAESLKDTKHTLQQLNAAMGKCTACHATYQIRTSLTDHSLHNP